MRASSCCNSSLMGVCVCVCVCVHVALGSHSISCSIPQRAAYLVFPPMRAECVMFVLLSLRCLGITYHEAQRRLLGGAMGSSGRAQVYCKVSGGDILSSCC